MAENLDPLVTAAQKGECDALEELVRTIQDRVHHLSMRMLVNPDDAFEATQEILILVITKLSTFRGESAFTTWVYRVATNYLLNAKRIRDRDLGLNFELFRADLENGLVASPAPSAEDTVMLNELRIACTMAMLLCLDRKHRIAYVLGDIFELGHVEAAHILGVSKDNYRKRLSRARDDVVAFTSQHCGLANANAKCSCPRRLPAAEGAGRVRSDDIRYALEDAPAYEAVRTQAKSVESALKTLKTLKLQTATPQFKSPEDLSARIAQIFEGPA